MGCDWRARFELRNPTRGVVRTFLQCVKYVKLHCFRCPTWSSTLQNVLDPVNPLILGNSSRTSSILAHCTAIHRETPGLLLNTRESIKKLRASKPRETARTGSGAGETGSGRGSLGCQPPREGRMRRFINHTSHLHIEGIVVGFRVAALSIAVVGFNLAARGNMLVGFNLAARGNETGSRVAAPCGRF